MRRNLHAGRALSAGFGLTTFSRDEVTAIHLATLEVLEHTGIHVDHAEALDIFAAGGARVNASRRMVRLPAWLVEESIAAAPSTLLLAGRDPRHDVVLEGNRVHFTNFSEGVKLVDPFTGEYRAPLKADLVTAARLIDFLPHVDVCEKAMGAHDVPPAVVPLHNAEAFLANTTKHVCVGPGNGRLLDLLVRMAAAVAGGREAFRRRPLLSFTTCPVSPLKLIDECCDIVIAAARHEAVLNILSMAMAGGSSPATLAGTLVTHNAEVLGGIVLSQLVRRGTPVIYGSSTTALDLKLGAAAVGTPECARISAAVARLARYYGLPSYVAGG